jgi:ATP-dependent RNA helicase DeaD
MSALEKKGYDQLTPVQEAVLDPKLADRDLRITSQTGSGKTVAIGFALRALAAEPCPAVAGVARPRAMIVAPTRELAQQVEAELTWLFANCPGRVASVTGGASYREERRRFTQGPAVIVGTPGRLLDHLGRGGIDASQVSVVALDEADRMLDLGFREELEAILKHAPEGHRTHLMSATFPRGVRTLADRVQKDAAHVEGTRLGAANADIDHVIHLVDRGQRVHAIINLLLAKPDAQTLVFARTRADVADIAAELSQSGFPASALSGEMDQDARNRALAAFKRGALRVLVATDVAARGIDVHDITRVIHAEPPTNADSYTHRSGRTGRAGRKGTSSLLVPPAAVVQATRLLRSAGVVHRFEPIPSAAELRRAADERTVAELTAPSTEDATIDPRSKAIAERIAAAGDPVTAIARMLSRVRQSGVAEPREVRQVAPPSARGASDRNSFERGGDRDRDRGPARGQARGEAAQNRPDFRDGSWAAFRVSWGEQHGADARRMLALLCRRGGIRGTDVGVIRVEQSFSIIHVAQSVAAAFELEAGKADPRDPRVVIRPDRFAAGASTDRPRAPESRPPRPPRERAPEPAPTPQPRAPEPARTVAAREPERARTPEPRAPERARTPEPRSPERARTPELRTPNPRAPNPRAPNPRAPNPRAPNPRAPNPRAPQSRAPERPRAPQPRAPEKPPTPFARTPVQPPVQQATTTDGGRSPLRRTPQVPPAKHPFAARDKKNSAAPTKTGRSRTER